MNRLKQEVGGVGSGEIMICPYCDKELDLSSTKRTPKDMDIYVCRDAETHYMFLEVRKHDKKRKP